MKCVCLECGAIAEDHGKGGMTKCVNGHDSPTKDFYKDLVVPDWFREKVLEVEDDMAYLIIANGDSMCRAGRFEEYDELLKEIDVSELTVHIMLGLLTVSHWARSKFVSRRGFYKRVEAEIIKREGKVEEGLLYGLDPTENDP